ncbi:hypothetical protein KEM48_001196 [Puccinia striiformis f. sp. tritici PST-130]|nr:hypothetical protein KEM48_001196 [Puccinia striiformis f. sp. tritici PST-130]
MHVSDELMAGMIVSRLRRNGIHQGAFVQHTTLTIEKVRAHLESKVRDNIGCPLSALPPNVNPSEEGLWLTVKTAHTTKIPDIPKPSVANYTRISSSYSGETSNAKGTESLHEENTVTIGGAIRAIRQEDGDQRNQDPLNHDSIIMTTASPHHMFPNRQHFTQYHQSSITQVKLLNGRSLEVEGVGYVNLENDEGVTHKFRALHVPKLTHPLLSMSRLFSKGCDLTRQGAHQAAIYDSKKNAKIFDVDLSPTNICIVKATLV